MAEISWGDTVFVALDADENFKPGAQGSVVGFREDPTSLGKELSGVRLCLVEFSNGIAIEIPEALLAKVAE
jgi:hypothetical protein